MNNKHLIILTLLIIGAGIIRLRPVTQHEKPLHYDSYYHVRVAQRIQETSSPLYQTNPWPREKRPRLYPPLYHLSLIGISSITGLSIITTTRFLLPIITLLISIPIYLLVKKHWDKNSALVAAALMLFNPPLIYSSYDSPQIIGVLLSIITIHLILKEKPIYGGITMGIAFLFNPFSGVFLSFPFIIYLLVKKEFKHTGLFASPIILSIIGWFSTRKNPIEILTRSLNISLGPEIVFPFAYQGLILGIIFSTLLVIILLLISGENNKQKNNHKETSLTPGKIKKKLQFISKDKLTLLLWIWLIFFFILFTSFLITPILYPWRQLLFFSIPLIILISREMTHPNIKSRQIFTFGVIFALISITAVSHLGDLKPPLSNSDYTMIEEAEEKIPEEARILAHHDTCANLLTLTDNQCELDIFFESAKNPERWVDYSKIFVNPEEVDIEKTLEENEIDYLLLTENDPSEKIHEEVELEKKYVSWGCEGNKCTEESSINKVKP